jgi:hypothetical protein
MVAHNQEGGCKQVRLYSSVLMRSLSPFSGVSYVHAGKALSNRHVL